MPKGKRTSHEPESKDKNKKNEKRALNVLFCY